MSLRSIIAHLWAKMEVLRMKNRHTNAVSIQNETLFYLLKKASHTQFAQEHSFDKIYTYQDFKKYVPIRDYEEFSSYINQILKGDSDVLWSGKPLYFAKTSGTTSGVKYIPISKASMPEHIKAARSALLHYIAETGNTEFLRGKMIFLQGSPSMIEKHGVKIGRLSGIVAHHVPQYLQKNRMPNYATNCIEDWEQKVDAIVEETFNENMTLISGIPPWVQMYFDKLTIKAKGKKIKDIFSKFSLFVYGGVNFEPYRAKIEESIGKKIDTIETYPASEGFIAFQNSQQEKGLLLLVDSGFFYEFIPTETYFDEYPTRLSLEDVELNKNYALVLSTNAGLWAYSIGDTIKFVSKNPYKIVVTGRIKHFISAFGEHVIGEEVEQALLAIVQKYQVELTEFTVAPQVNPPEGGLPYHEWLIEFATPPKDVELFSAELDIAMRAKNIYYADLIEGNILQPLKIRCLKQDSFVIYMKIEGKLGGQNKVPRLSNDRKLADKIIDLQ